MFILAYFFETHVYEDRFKTFLENAYYEKNLHEFKKKISTPKWNPHSILFFCKLPEGHWYFRLKFWELQWLVKWSPNSGIQGPIPASPWLQLPVLSVKYLTSLESLSGLLSKPTVSTAQGTSNGKPLVFQEWNNPFRQPSSPLWLCLVAVLVTFLHQLFPRFRGMFLLVLTDGYFVLWILVGGD